jgi:hypothetical protein
MERIWYDKQGNVQPSGCIPLLFEYKNAFTIFLNILKEKIFKSFVGIIILNLE